MSVDARVQLSASAKSQPTASTGFGCETGELGSVVLPGAFGLSRKEVSVIAIGCGAAAAGGSEGRGEEEWDDDAEDLKSEMPQTPSPTWRTNLAYSGSPFARWLRERVYRRMAPGVVQTLEAFSVKGGNSPRST